MKVLVYRAEVALVLDDPATAAEMLDQPDGVSLGPDEALRAAAAHATATDLRAALS